MQTCSRCNTQTPDEALTCPNCQSEMAVYSTRTVALTRLKANPRVKKIRIAVSHDACPACQQLQKAYDKENVPVLPVKGCSHEGGCRCFYEPILDEIYP
ncbi:MAG: zinc ribbon domain-containing protein [Anaerolineaceae bacterium]